LDLLENIHTKLKKIHYMRAGVAGRHVVGLEDLSIDVLQEVENEKYD
jgi:hypothetical protein